MSPHLDTRELIQGAICATCTLVLIILLFHHYSTSRRAFHTPDSDLTFKYDSVLCYSFLLIFIGILLCGFAVYEAIHVIFIYITISPNFCQFIVIFFISIYPIYKLAMYYALISPNTNNNNIESSPSIPSNTNNIELLPLVSPNRNNNNIEPLPSIPHCNPLGFALLDGANMGNISFDPTTTQVQIPFQILQFLVNNQQIMQQSMYRQQQEYKHDITQVQEQLTQLQEAQLQATKQQTAQLHAEMHNNKNEIQNKIDLSLKKIKNKYNINYGNGNQING
eukprot:131716_1